MNKWLGFSGWLGFVLFVFGLCGYFVTGSFTQPLIAAHLILGIIGMLLWLSLAGVRQAGLAREVVRGRTARFSFNVVLYSVVIIGLLGVVNWFINRHDRRWDLTKEGVYSLATQSQKVIADLKAPLKIVALVNIGMDDDEKLRQRFELYRYHNPSKVTVEFLDPRVKPHLLDLYGFKPGNLVYLQYGEGEQAGINRLNETGEEAVTNAIIKLARGASRKIYFVQGHGEPDLGSEQPVDLKEFAGAIGDENLTLEGILLSRVGAVPDDASAVVLVSPRKPMLLEERNLLIKYVEGGGRLLLFTDPRGSADVKELAAHFGIEIGDNVVIDQVQRLFAGPALGAQPVITEYDKAHPVTKDMRPTDITIFNIASTVRASKQPQSGAVYTELIKSSPTAWGEADLAKVFDTDKPVAVLEQGRDIAGPVCLGMSYEKKISGENENAAEKKNGDDPSFQKTSRMVVFGDSDWILNANLGVYANRDLVLNALNWLIGEEGGIYIRPRSISASAAPIQEGTFILILVCSFLIPEIILLLGLLVWWRRKTVGA